MNLSLRARINPAAEELNRKGCSRWVEKFLKKSRMASNSGEEKKQKTLKKPMGLHKKCNKDLKTSNPNEKRLGSHRKRTDKQS